MHKLAAVEFSVPVSREEKVVAEKLRAEIENFLESIDDFLHFHGILKESLDKLSSGKQLAPISGLVNKYTIKLRNKFNDCVRSLRKVLDLSNELYQESKTTQIKDSVVGSFTEARLLLINLLTVLEDYHSDTFIDKSKNISDQINKYLEKVKEILDDQWTGHIDRHILNRTRLS